MKEKENAFTRDARRVCRALPVLLLLLTLSACVQQQPQLRAHEVQVTAVKEMVAELKAEPTEAPASVTSPGRLVALSSVRASDFYPVKPGTSNSPGSWFHEPSVEHLEECPHCKALGNIISSQYGTRRDPRNRSIRLHHGIDIRAPKGSPVLAFKGGVVVRAERNRTYGLIVEVRQYDGFVARYAHLSKMLVRTGDEIEAGNRLGAVGATGRTTGSHLHFELLKNGESLNPMIFLTRTEQVVRCLYLESATATK